MKWLVKSRKKRGEFQLLSPDVAVTLNHYIDVEGEGNARAIAEQLYGFNTSVGLSPFDHGIGLAIRSGSPMPTSPTTTRARGPHRRWRCLGRRG